MSPKPFILSKTWQGPKPGYYFGTSKENGTGYHEDPYQKKRNMHAEKEIMQRPSKRAKRVVVNEDRNETRKIPSLLERAEASVKNTKVMDLTTKGVQLALKNLVKAHEKNQLRRAQHTNEPQMYMESELSLYEAIATLQPIAADPPNLYPPMVQNDDFWTITLTQLCLHENSDIVSSLVALLLELMDPTLMEMDLDVHHPTNLPILQLARAIVEHLLEFLVANLARLEQQSGNPAPDDDAQIGKGVEDVLALMENILEIDLFVQNNTPSQDTSILLTSSSQVSVAAILVKTTPFLSWLFKQIESGSPSKARSLDILSLLSQREEIFSVHPDWTQLKPYHSTFDRESCDDKKKKSDKPILLDGIEILLLHGIAPFRKNQPKDESELECLENSCIALEASLTFSPLNLKGFLKAQGIELVIRCLKEKVHAGGFALKLLDFSGIDPIHKQAAEHLVAEAEGLKHLFPLFMGRRIPKPALLGQDQKSSNQTKAKREWLQMIETQTIRVLYALTRHLSDESPNDAKERLVVKFLEADKCDRLVELCVAYDQRARVAEYKFWKSDIEEEVQENEEGIQLLAFEAKLRGGGEIFHRLGALAGFLCVASKRCHEHILARLALQKSGIAVIKDALQEFVSILGSNQQREKLTYYLEQI